MDVQAGYLSSLASEEQKAAARACLMGGFAALWTLQDRGPLIKSAGGIKTVPCLVTWVLVSQAGCARLLIAYLSLLRAPWASLETLVPLESQALQ